MEQNKKEVKELDLTKPYFEANGKKYFIETKLSIARYVEYQILEQEVGYSISFSKLFEKIKDCYLGLRNARSFGDSADVMNKLNDLMHGVANLEQKEPPILKLCTLFINTENENRAEWNDDLATKKIEDWKAENYEIDGFFQLALNFINGFVSIYKEVNRNISEEESEMSLAKKQKK